MRLSATLLTVWAGCSIVLANPVGLQSARRHALRFLNGEHVRRVAPRHAPVVPADVDVTLSYQASSSADSTSSYYVFDIDRGGYIIVSGDDRTVPVLGYTETGSFDREHLPAALRSLLADFQSVQRAPQVPRALRGEASWVEVPPLVETQWDQTPPYNNLCPIDPDAGERSLTGCVPVALAQLMRYHHWPVRGTGSYSYEYRGNVYEANFGETEYQWDNMSSKYGADSPAASASAVATLLYHCAVLANTEFRYNGSWGRYDTEMLAKHFGYAPVVSWMERDKVSDEVFMETLYGDVVRGLPVIYRSDDVNGMDSHVWLVDGYRRDGYFHCNWGWGGTDDGYFHLSSLAPKTTGYHFQGGQSIMYNIYPQEETSWYIVSSDKRYAQMSAVGSLVAVDDEETFDVLGVDGGTLIHGVTEAFFTQDIDPYITSGISAVEAPQTNVASLSVSGKLTLSGISHPVRVYALDGLPVLTVRPVGDHAVVDVSTLKSGIYLVRCGRQSFKFFKK